MAQRSRRRRVGIDHLRDIVLEAALASGKVLERHFGSNLDIREKKGAGLVTNADMAAEEAALRILRKAYPDFGELTEESAPHERASASSRGRWILDPLDGTTNFIHGFPMFCVSIAAEWEKQLVVGVIHHPILKETYIGVRGKGSTLNGKRMRVSKTGELTDALLTTGFSYTRGRELHADVLVFERLAGIARAVRRPGSAALDLAYTACGVFDGFWERNLSAWDVAAGAVIIREAGGKVTDFKGKDFNASMKEVVAANSDLHPKLLASLTAKS